MSDPTVEELFVRYRERGDAGAFAELYDRTSPEVLRVAMCFARHPAEAEDLVQATYLAAIEGAQGFDAGKRVLPWLLGILANQARWAKRRAARSPDAEQLEPPRTSDPLGDAQREEFTQRVDDAIAMLPEVYQPLLVLYLKHGLPAAEVAHALRRPPGTVRTQLVRGLELLRAALPRGLALAAFAWLVPARGLAAVRHVVVAKATSAAAASWILLGGGLFMKKLVTVLSCALLLVLAGYLLWPELAGATVSEATDSTAPAVAAGAPDRREAPPSAPLVRTPLRDEAATSVPAFGAARLFVVWDADGAPATGVHARILVWKRDNPHTHAIGAASDERGEISLAGLEPGRVSVYPDRCEGASFDVRAGEVVERTIRIPLGIDMSIIVVDQAKQPVPEADIWVSDYFNHHEGQVVGRTDAAGRFHIRDFGKSRYVAARAAGHRPSPPYLIPGAPGERMAKEIVLVRGGGAVDGSVRDALGRPCPQALVTLGPLPRTEEVAWDGQVPPEPPPFKLRTDDLGRFAAEGLPPGRLMVSARARGSATWTGSVQVTAARRANIEIALMPEAVVAGTVRDDAGEPIAEAEVFVREEDPLAWRSCSTTTQKDGSYRLREVTPGARTLVAVIGKRKEAHAIRAVAGPANHVDFVLPRERSEHAVAGNVVDEKGRALAGWIVNVLPYEQMPQWWGYEQTDKDGAFRADNCPDRPFHVELFRPGSDHVFPSHSVPNVRRGPTPLHIVVPANRVEPAEVAALVLDESGTPLAGVELTITRPFWNTMATPRSDASGRVRYGQLTAGRYRFVLRAEGRAQTDCGEHEVSSGQVLELGTCRLGPGITCKATVLDAAGQPLSWAYARILGARGGEACRAAGERNELTFGPLAPGRYAALVGGDGVALTRIEFDVTAGQREPFAWRLPAGVVRSFELVEPGAGAAPPRAYELSVRGSDGDLVHAQTVPARSDLTTPRIAVHLGAGAWRVEVLADTGLRGDATCVVELGAAEAKPTRIELR